MSLIKDKAIQGLPIDNYTIIDCHNHIGLWRNFNVGYGSEEGMLVTMDKLGIDICILTAHSSIGADFEYGNNQVINAVMQYQNRFYGYITVNPYYDTITEIERCLKIKGMIGLKIHAELHKLPIDSPLYEEAYAIADKKSLVVLIHTWGIPAIKQCENIAKKFKNAIIIMAHCGGTDISAMKEAISVCKKYENVYVDTALSMPFEGNIEWLFKSLGSEKILFGSDMPFYDASHTFGRIALSNVLSEDDKKNIFGNNILNLIST